MDWYYVKDGNQTGPFTEADLKRLVESGDITDQTLVWHEGMEQWSSYGSVTGSPVQGEGKGQCRQCGREFPVSELIQYQGLSVCAECKPAFFQRVKEGAELPGVMNYAGFWIRFCAKFVDNLILGGFNFLLGIIIGMSFPGIAMMPEARLILNLVELLVQICYLVFFHGRFGATPGKMACKIKVVRADGSRITYGRALGRCFAEWLSGMILLMGYIMAAFDSQKRALHDRICDTRVIRKE